MNISKFLRPMALGGLLALTPVAQASSIFSNAAVGVTAGSLYPSASITVKDGVILENTFTNPSVGVPTTNAGPLGSGVTNAFANASYTGSNFASASAGADLATGKLRGTVAVSGPVLLGQGGFVDARFSDTVTFNNISGAQALLSISYSIEGSFLNPAHIDFANAVGVFNLLSNYGSSSVQLVGGGPLLADQIQVNISDISGTTYGATSTPTLGLAGWTASSVPFPVGVRQSAVLAIPTGLSYLSIFSQLKLDCRVGASCDFGNTAQAAFGKLPTGLSFTSGSGVFLTGAGSGSAVPEPGTWAMLSGGILAMVVRRRSLRS